MEKEPCNPVIRTLSYCIVLIALLLATAACGPEPVQNSYLANWSRDGKLVALVPDVLSEDDEPDRRPSGVWVYSAGAVGAREVFPAPQGLICFHPQWSPFCDELLFVTFEEKPESEAAAEESLGFSVWLVGPEGQAPHQVASGSCSKGEAIALSPLRPNLATWGDLPGTVIYQKCVGGKVSAFILDLGNGAERRFLPGFADAYALEPSPDRRKAAALLYDADSGLAAIYISNFGFDNWRLLDVMPYDSSQLESLSAAIYWAPDSSSFIVPAVEPGADIGSRGLLRRYFARTGTARTIASGKPQSVVQWNSESTAFAFSAVGRGAESDLQIWRVDVATGRQVVLIPDGENHLMAWNPRDGRIYFYRTSRPDDSASSEVLSCAADGSDVRAEGLRLDEARPSWSASPDGSRLVFFADTRAPILLDPARGFGIRLQF